MTQEPLDDFDKFARDYKAILDKSLKFGGEKGEYFSAYKAGFIARQLGRGFQGKILEHGCGVGLLSQDLLRQFPGSTVDGYDVSALSIGHVPPNLKHQGCFTPDFDQLAGGYDLIVVANVLHHIETPEREKEIVRLKKLLKSGGRIIIFEHNPLNPLTRKIVRDSPLDHGVVLLPSTETILYLKNAGFLNIKRSYIVFFPRIFSVLRWLEPYLSWLPWGAQYALMGQA